MGSHIYTLRDAEQSDLEFLFGVVIAVRQTKEIFNWQTELLKYKEKFDPKKIQVIRYQDRDIGRLRVERKTGSIYVGGIQILPIYQNRGIGSAILSDLIAEAGQVGVPLTLEVHEMNTDAYRLYNKLGFVDLGKNKDEEFLINLICPPK